MTKSRYAVAIFSLFFAFATPTFALETNQQKPDQSPDKLNRCNQNTALETRGEIVKSVDGDTVHLRTASGTYSVRLLGMDTPETHFMGKSQGEWAERASATLKELLPNGTPVVLDLGDISCDMHGRVLAHLFREKMHVNGEMVKRGLAVNYCVAPDFRYCEDFSRHTAHAIANKQGMFSQKNVELPYDFRRRIGNHEQRSYVGNIDTKEVYAPGRQNEVPTAERVFFYTRADIKDPYRVVESLPEPLPESPAAE